MKQFLVIMMIMILGIHKSGEINFERTITGVVTGADDGLPLPQVTVLVKGTKKGVPTDIRGKYSITLDAKDEVLVFRYLGYKTQEIKVGKKEIIDVHLQPDYTSLSEVVVTGLSRRAGKRSMALSAPQNMNLDIEVYDEQEIADFSLEFKSSSYFNLGEASNESYKSIEENGFKSPFKNPYSTFSIDVDAASYSNVRRFINQGVLPPKDAVKIEELINYFNYDYQAPSGKHPFGVQHQVGRAPWNKDHYLVHVGIQGDKLEMDKEPASNIVFLLDVSGSMNSANKLPLLKKSLRLLVNELRPEDKVSIVVYAGAAGKVLSPTSGDQKGKIIAALDKLEAGGSTAGGQGIKLAYKIAQRNFIEGGNNRIVLATDGDFNVGASSDQAMEELIEEKRKSGVFLTVLGYGMGNYKDSKMEVLADKGNGNYAYIDNLLEAKKVLVNEFGGTLYTIAKDVKIQVEFNPATVDAYRLIGYENRLLADEDFNNDKKDAGELGSGHSVTALYEVIPMGVKSTFKPLDKLKYQKQAQLEQVGNTIDLMTVKLRYKQPNETKSVYLDTVVKNELTDEVNENFNWSASMAAFGMLLRESDFINELSYDKVISMARSAKGKDAFGYRAEAIKLIEMAQLMVELEE